MIQWPASSAYLMPFRRALRSLLFMKVHTSHRRASQRLSVARSR